MAVMEPSIRISRAQRIGGALGRLWQRCRRLDRNANRWLVAQGLPAGLAQAVLWIVKLGVLGILFYAVFWVALVFLIVAAVAGLAQHIDWSDEKQPEFRDGHSSIGLYDKNDLRIDPGDPYDP